MHTPLNFRYSGNQVCLNPCTKVPHRNRKGLWVPFPPEPLSEPLWLPRPQETKKGVRAGFGPQAKRLHMYKKEDVVWRNQHDSNFHRFNRWVEKQTRRLITSLDLDLFGRCKFLGIANVCWCSAIDFTFPSTNVAPRSPPPKKKKTLVQTFLRGGMLVGGRVFFSQRPEEHL